MTEEDIIKFVRLGTIWTVFSMEQLTNQSRKARLVLIKFRDRIIKNQIMELVGKLKGADEKFSKIIFTHDKNAEDREEYRCLVHTQNRFMALWILSRTTQVSQYQKKHSPSVLQHVHTVR